MGAKLKCLEMAIPTLCRSNLIPRWEWLSLFCIVLSCCHLPLPSESASVPAGYVWNGDKEFANITGPTTYKRISTTYLVSSPNDRSALALTIETSNTSSPLCYLVVVYFSAPSISYASAPPPGYPPSGAWESITPWTHPCPRTPLPNGNCTFAFTKAGDIQLLNSVGGRSVLVWSSNTTGLGATTLDMLDYDISDDRSDGNLVLYNSSGNIVWANVGNDSNFQCHITFPKVTSLAAKKKASVTLMCLVLSLGALVLWDLGTARSGRNQLLAFGFVVCCLLLPSTSQSKPIQAGFIANVTRDYAAGRSGELGNTTLWIQYTPTAALVVSPANRTDLVLRVLLTKNWGATCYLEVVADKQTTEIIFASVPAPSTDVNTFQYVPWSAPCPRKLLPNGNCTLAFTKDGDIQVLNGVAGGYNAVWSSNTTGLGSTTLNVLDSDPSGSGSIVLYNARNEVV